MNSFLGLVLATLLVFGPTNVRADLHPGDFEIQGVCVTGMDPRAETDEHFEFAVTGPHNADANSNEPFHVHLDDLVHDGFLPSAEAAIGHSYIFSVYWVQDDAGKHARAYVPKGEVSLEEVPCEVALQITQNTKDQYLPEGTDKEMLTQKGLGADGQTTTEQGRPRGKE